MTPHGRAWECAYVLTTQYPERLTLAQHVACLVALMAGPDLAGLGIIALAATTIPKHDVDVIDMKV